MPDAIGITGGGWDVGGKNSLFELIYQLNETQKQNPLACQDTVHTAKQTGWGPQTTNKYVGCHRDYIQDVICKFHNILLLLVVHQNIPLTFTIHHNSFAVYWLQLSHSPDSSTINDRQKQSNGRTKRYVQHMPQRIRSFIELVQATHREKTALFNL